MEGPQPRHLDHLPHDARLLVDDGIRGLRGVLHDEEHDGWYAEITPDICHMPTKQAYAHAFVLLAASSALLAGRPGAKELLEQAENVYLTNIRQTGAACLGKA